MTNIIKWTSSDSNFHLRRPFSTAKLDKLELHRQGRRIHLLMGDIQ